MICLCSEEIEDDHLSMLRYLDHELNQIPRPDTK